MNLPRLAAFVPLLLLPACAAPAARDEGVLRATLPGSAPVVDGRDDDAAWREAEPLTIPVAVPLGGAAAPREVEVRAAARDGVLYLLLRWEDPTEDRTHKPWTPKEGGGSAPGPELEDVAAVAFPIEGEFVADMLAPVECTWDVWHWKAARTDPAGFAMDKHHVHSFTDPGGKRHEARLADGRLLYIRRPEDAGTSSTRTLPAPAAGAAPQYAAQAPSGSAADVRARGAWSGGRWTLELSRPLRTGHPDDADLSLPGGAFPFAIAVFDRCEGDEHAASEVRTLRLPDAR